MTKLGADNRATLAVSVNDRCASRFSRKLDEPKPLMPIRQELHSPAISDPNLKA